MVSPPRRSVAELARSALPRFVGRHLSRREMSSLLASPDARRQARQQMEFLLGATADLERVEAAIEPYIEFMSQRSYYRWNPRLAVDQQVLEARKMDVLKGSRPVIIAFAHHGHYDGLFGALRRAGGDFHVLVDGIGLNPGAPNFLRQHLRVVGARGGSLIDVGGERDRLRAALLAGENVAIAPDVPGSTPATIFGRDLLGSFGIALLAHRNEGLILPVTALPGRRVLVHDALDSSDHDRPQGLYEAALRPLEESILAWPEAYDRPLKRWGIPPGSSAERFRINGPEVV